VQTSAEIILCLPGISNDKLIAFSLLPCALEIFFLTYFLTYLPSRWYQ